MSEKTRMDKATATEVLGAVMALEPFLNKVDTAVSAIPDPVMKTRFVVALGKIFQSVTMDFILPIVAQYPELDPDKPFRN